MTKLCTWIEYIEYTLRSCRTCIYITHPRHTQMDSHYALSLQTGSRQGCTRLAEIQKGPGPIIKQTSRSKNRRDTYGLGIQKHSALYNKNC
ncbi:hypothetical protein BDV93DRAFT_294952 [Ceratobasidium sp. AG-I]|nr:hypothetical protein BDV93DRAFT_294952 [Ceratobasidium sp. AG-I]